MQSQTARRDFTRLLKLPGSPGSGLEDELECTLTLCSQVPYDL